MVLFEEFLISFHNIQLIAAICIINVMLHSIMLLRDMFPSFGIFNITIQKAINDIFIYLQVKFFYILIIVKRKIILDFISIFMQLCNNNQFDVWALCG